MGNRGPPPDVTIPQGDSSNFGMNTRRSVHMSSVRAKRSEGSVFVYLFTKIATYMQNHKYSRDSFKHFSASIRCFV